MPARSRGGSIDAPAHPASTGSCARASRREALGAGALGLALAALFLFANPLLSERHMASLWSDPDIAWQAYPAKALLAREVGQGRLPLENRHVFAGMPFAGNPQAQLFYPPSLLFLAFSIPAAFAVSAWLHFVLAFAGTFLLARHVLGGGASARAGALLAAAVAAFAGPMTTQLQQIAIFHTSAWIPLFFLGLLRGRVTLAAVATAGILLAGHTQIASYTLTLGALLLALETLRRRHVGEPALGPALGAVAGLVLGAGLASVMLLPAGELLAISMRGAGVTKEFASVMAFEEWHFPLVYDPAAYAGLKGDAYWTYPYVGTATLVLALAGLWSAGAPSRLARTLVAVAAASVVVRPAISTFISTTGRIRAMQAFYLDHWDWLVLLGKGWAVTAALLPLVVLLALALLHPSRPLTWAVVTFASLILTLGPAAPLLGGLFELPVLSQGRGTVRFFHLYAPAVALLAAFPVADAVRRSERRPAARRQVALLALPLLAAILLAAAPWEERWPTTPFALGLAAATIWLLVARRGAAGAARFVPHALVLLELFTFGTESRRLTNPDLYRYEEMDRLLPERDRGARILTLGSREMPLVFNAGMVEDYDAVLGYEPLALRSATELVSLAAPMATFERPGGKLADLRDMQDVASPAFVTARTLPLLALMRCRYVVCRGLDLLADRQPLRADVEGTPPARRVLEVGGRRLECHMLRLPSQVTFRLPGSASPIEVAWEVVADPDAATGLTDAAFTGSRISARLEAGGRVLASDSVEVPKARGSAALPVIERRLTAPPADAREIRLVMEASALDPSFTGLVWVGATHPRVAAVDPAGARALAERLRPLPDAGAPREGIHVYELPAALGLAVAPERSSRADAAAALVEPGFDPARTLLLPDRAEGPLPRARIDRAEDSDGVLRVGYEAAASTWLLLTRAYLPGLVATAGGAPVPLARADLHFTAAHVPAGRHVLEVRYAPLSYRLGLFGSASSLALLLGLVAARRGRLTVRSGPPGVRTSDGARPPSPPAGAARGTGP